jgi:preprotein translocase subunit SecD
VALAICAVALAAAGTMTASLAASPVEAVPVALELVAVDDDADWLEPHVDDPEAMGFSFELENVPLGPTRSAPRFFARVEGEAVPAGVAEWLAARAPDGRRVAWERWYDRDDADRLVARGWRAYLLHAKADLDGADVIDAVAKGDAEGWRVLITLDDSGADRFEALTQRQLKRRIAIVVDGSVVSAPVVREPIRGGSISISMGAGTVEGQRQEAEELAAALRGGGARVRRTAGGSR